MKKLMRKLVLLLVLAVLTTVVFAGNAHFVGLPTLNQTDDTVFSSGKIAGLGNIAQINVTVSGDAACINPGQQDPKAANKESFSVDGTFPVQNGRAIFTLALLASFQPDCNPPMSVVWSNLSIVVSLDDGTVLLTFPR